MQVYTKYDVYSFIYFEDTRADPADASGHHSAPE